MPEPSAQGGDPCDEVEAAVGDAARLPVDVADRVIDLLYRLRTGRDG